MVFYLIKIITIKNNFHFMLEKKKTKNIFFHFTFPEYLQYFAFVGEILAQIFRPRVAMLLLTPKHQHKQKQTNKHIHMHTYTHTEREISTIPDVIHHTYSNIVVMTIVVCSLQFFKASPRNALSMVVFFPRRFLLMEGGGLKTYRALLSIH